MKRDMDLVRAILLEMERRPSTGGGNPIQVEGHGQDEVGYHLRLLVEAGLIRAVDVSSYRGPEEEWDPVSLTWEGHEFLDASRDIGRWNRAMALIKEKAGHVGFDVLKDLLAGLARNALGI